MSRVTLSAVLNTTVTRRRVVRMKDLSDFTSVIARSIGDEAIWTSFFYHHQKSCMYQDLPFQLTKGGRT
jgi:hypothetical protein